MDPEVAADPDLRALHDILPPLVAAGRLVMLDRTPDGATVPVVQFFTNRGGEISQLGGLGMPDLPSALMNHAVLDRWRPGAEEGKNSEKRRHWAHLRAALASLPTRAPDLRHHFPGLLARTLTSAWSFFWDPEAGRYVPAVGGFDPTRRHLHVGPSVRDLPLLPRVGVVELWDRLGLDEAARARWLAFVVGTLLRHELPVMPAMLVASPGKGTGKSVLCELAAAVYAGAGKVTPSLWAGPADLGKRLGGVVEAGEMVYIDNVTPTRQASVGRGSVGEFHADEISIATQGPDIKVRVLGTSQSAVVRRPIFVLNSQQPRVSWDLVDRLLFVLVDRPSPASIPAGTDARVWVARHADDVRTEIIYHLLQSRPLDAVPPGLQSRMRFPDWYRHVAPVVMRYGLSPDLIRTEVDYAYSAHARDLVELISSLEYRGEPFTVVNLLNHLTYSTHWASLCEAVGVRPGTQRSTTHAASALRAMEDVVRRTAASPAAFANDYGHFRVVEVPREAEDDPDREARWRLDVRPWGQ